MDYTLFEDRLKIHSSLFTSIEITDKYIIYDSITEYLKIPYSSLHSWYVENCTTIVFKYIVGGRYRYIEFHTEHIHRIIRCLKHNIVTILFDQKRIKNLEEGYSLFHPTLCTMLYVI